MHLIGLTGGFCCGKSFVLKVLVEQGCYTMRADDQAKAIIARALPQIPAAPGCSCHRALRNAIMTDRTLWPAKTRAELKWLLPGKR